MSNKGRERNDTACLLVNGILLGIQVRYIYEKLL